MRKLLRRDSTTCIFGVCGAIADVIDCDPTLVRLCWSALTVCTFWFPGCVLYAISALIIPKENTK